MYNEYREYHHLVQLNLDLEWIKAELDSAEYETDYIDPYFETKAVYLGTVFGLTPSGKYYTPFACSNVKVHINCQGKGCRACGYIGSREALLDAVWHELVENALDEIDAYLMSGEGDPCDLFAAMSREAKED
jgi:hypothetical protein